MSDQLRTRLFDTLNSLTIVDPHTHINAAAPASRTLADVLGYHYYTELAHSAGMPRGQIEEPGLSPKEKVRRLVERLGPIENTVQYGWLIEMCREFFGFRDQRLTAGNWEALFDGSAATMADPGWPDAVLGKSRIRSVFLTNDFDDPLAGFDVRKYVPCLRTDDLVFRLCRPDVRQRLSAATAIEPADPAALRRAIGRLFEHFVAKGARACAVSLPPRFAPTPVTAREAGPAVRAAFTVGPELFHGYQDVIERFVFWTLAEFCAEFKLPFDLMIGVNRQVYPGGVHQGQDLYDSRVSLIQYRELFNAFPQVVFPVSVLASVTNQELASYAWIFPNVVCNGHWWYSNTPTFIEHDLAARLEAVPAGKLIGYYSDMYKLEFALPKFAMFKRVLAKVLAERFVVDRGWSEERAAALGTQVLRDNTERIFRM
jgi:glucuronate isomerase